MRKTVTILGVFIVSILGICFLQNSFSQVAAANNTLHNALNITEAVSANNWVVEDVDANENVLFEDRSLDLDSFGRPHFAYNNHYVYLFNPNQSTWLSKTIDPAGAIQTNLVLGNDNKAHFGYLDPESLHLKYAIWDGVNWQREIVDDSARFGAVSLRIDSSGYPHIGYIDYDNFDLKYAYFDGASWLTETIDSTSYVIRAASLDLDGTDQPQISYFDGDANAILYAQWDGADWLTETVTVTSGYVGELLLNLNKFGSADPQIVYIDNIDVEDRLVHAFKNGNVWETTLIDTGYPDSLSARVDNLNHIHVSYVADSGEPLSYAYFDGNGWQLSEISFFDGVSVYGSSITVNTLNEPCVVYYELDNGDIQYACMDGNWSRETAVADASSSVGDYNSLAIDSNGFPHVSYYDAVHSNLLYAQWDGSDWQHTNINDFDPDFYPNSWGQYSSLALDRLDRPHISFHDSDWSITQPRRGLMYTHWDGFDWNIEIVDGRWSTGRHTSLVLGPLDAPNIGYSGENEVAYARKFAGNWITQTVASGSSYEEISLALDSNFDPHMSYIEGDDVVYAQWNGFNWITETISTPPTEVYQTDFALDSNDSPHFVYRTSNTIVYVTWNGSNWVRETIHSLSGLLTLSLVLDSQDQPHISFLDWSDFKLKYIYQNGADWETETVYSGYVADASLALDSVDKPFISFGTASLEYFSDLKLAKRQPAPISTVITPAGGMFAPTPGFTFTFPANAFSEPVTVTYKAIDPIPHTLVDVGVFYELTAVSTAANQPAQLAPGTTFTAVVPYNQANVPSGVSEDSLKLFYQTGGSVAQQPNSTSATWEPAGSSVVDMVVNEITAVDSHLGIWAIFSEEPGGGYKVYLPAVVKP